MSQRIRFFLGVLAIFALGVGITLLLLTLLHRQLGGTPLQHADVNLVARVHTIANPGLTRAMLALTYLGAIRIFAPALACVVLWLASRRREDEAALLGGGIAGAFVLNEALKLHFHRLRPRVPWSIGDEHTYSYPSGHSLFAVVLYGTLAYLALRPRVGNRRRMGVLLPALLLPLGIGLSRIYLGMHYASDVLAGWLAGGLWLVAVITVDRTWRAHAATRNLAR